MFTSYSIPKIGNLPYTVGTVTSNISAISDDADFPDDFNNMDLHLIR